jgi:hypothetical protein
VLHKLLTRLEERGRLEAENSELERKEGERLGLDVQKLKHERLELLQVERQAWEQKQEAQQEEQKSEVGRLRAENERLGLMRLRAENERLQRTAEIDLEREEEGRG